MATGADISCRFYDHVKGLLLRHFHVYSKLKHVVFVHYQKIDKAPHLADMPNVFAVKYISNLGTHSMGFAGADKDHIVKNTNPTPNNQWFGFKNSQLADIRELNRIYTKNKNNLDPKYSNFYDYFAQQKFDKAVPRVNDLQWIQCARPKGLVNANVDFIENSKKCTMKNVEE